MSSEDLHQEMHGLVNGLRREVREDRRQDEVRWNDLRLELSKAIKDGNEQTRSEVKELFGTVFEKLDRKADKEDIKTTQALTRKNDPWYKDRTVLIVAMLSAAAIISSALITRQSVDELLGEDLSRIIKQEGANHGNSE